MTNNNKPIHEIRVDSVQAAIWEAEGQKGRFHTVNFSRSYVVNGKFNRSHSFSGRHLTALGKAVAQAAEWIATKEASVE